MQTGPVPTTTPFDAMATAYDRVRPDYPAALYENLATYIGAGSTGANPCPAAPLAALEIGAGTGKATAVFLAAGHQVTAVEAGPQLAAGLRARFCGHEGFRVITAPFEAAALPENHFQLVYAASAFHWLNADASAPKVFRLLRPGGVLALFRYHLVPVDTDTFQAMQAAYRQHYHQPYHPPPLPTAGDCITPAGLARSFGFSSMAHHGFAHTTATVYRQEISFTADEYLALLDTFTDHRSLPKDRRIALYAGVRAAIVHSGRPYRAAYLYPLWMGRKP